jgi:hypothetical protein
MSTDGFRLPPEAVEAGALVLLKHASVTFRDTKAREVDRERAAEVLSAALPALAESDELVDRMAQVLARRRPGGWGRTSEEFRAFYRDRAVEVLHDLFRFPAPEGDARQ